MKGVCKLCGCTEDNACVTETGPCHWVTEDLCSACADLVEELHLIIPHMCRFCKELKEGSGSTAGLFTCRKYRFADLDIPHARLWVRWSGVWTSNKTVTEAQRHCPYFLAVKDIRQVHANGRPA